MHTLPICRDKPIISSLTPLGIAHVALQQYNTSSLSASVTARNELRTREGFTRADNKYGRYTAAEYHEKEFASSVKSRQKL